MFTDQKCYRSPIVAYYLKRYRFIITCKLFWIKVTHEGEVAKIYGCCNLTGQP